MSKTLFILLSSYLLSIIFFIGLLPRIITNNLSTDTSVNPFRYSNVLINN